MTTPSSSPIRVGLIGYGYAGKTFHAPLIRAVSGFHLTVVGSSKPERVLADIPGVTVCSAMETATHPELDLIVIATPNESHLPLAAAAIKAGKHVVVDKPFTLDLAEARQLVALAKEHNRLLSVFQNRRWESDILAAKSILASGALGKVVHFEAHMDRFRPLVRQRWREDPGPGAGLWFDLGPHLIDLTLHLFGLPDSVLASFATLRPGGKTDDWAHVQLLYPDMRVVLNATLLSSGGVVRTLIHGTQATWAKYGTDVQEKQLVEGIVPGTRGFGDDPDPGILFDGATGQRTEIPVPHADQIGYYIRMRDAILGHGPLPVSPESAIAVMALLETSFASGKQGKVLPLLLTEAERQAYQEQESNK
ncbi:oxidoreductase [Edaphobacter albus]|uniref:oxidoreductase n=1 Tax=Edaphobacter sp. 4G125 TaxID=2763071 RepID=UPI001645A589|nr:oxidoreductase [Edaphobacter sp. 4G125]QNI35369.1 oxidoreductase [Edaphobacter sp. 4G125]